MSYATDLAKELKKRNNIKNIGNVIGTVLSITPLKIGILNSEVILDNCILTKTFKTLLDTVYVDSREVNIGDKVLVVPDAIEQTFFVIDKVVM